MGNRTLEVWSIPLRHRVPCAGFLFREKEPPLNVEKFKIAKYGLSIAQITAAKRGEDVVLNSGETIPNACLTYRPYAPRSYAYLSDTNYSAKAAGLCKGVDLMYHEATYAAAEQRSAKDRGHSTTADAAKAALKAGARRLVIGHYSSRYKDESQLVEEARALFPESYPATEGTTYSIEKNDDQSRNTTRPRAGRQTRPHRTRTVRRRRGEAHRRTARLAPAGAQDIRPGGSFRRPEVETVARATWSGSRC